MNNCVLKGRLVADPELRQTPSNISVCKFTVAVDAYAKEGEKKADFIPCTAWRGTADFISKYFTKGQEILVFGALKNNDYTDKDGVKRYGFNLQVSQAEFCGSKSSNTSASETPNNSNPLGDMTGFEEILSDGDVPF